MELTLERTHDTATIGSTPCTIWTIVGGDGARLGVACIAEIVATPGTRTPDCLNRGQARTLLALELRGRMPRIHVQPTEHIVGVTDDAGSRTAARLWLGRSDAGLQIAAFICAFAAEDENLRSLLDEELMSIETLTEVVPLESPLPHVAGLGYEPDAPLR